MKRVIVHIDSLVLKGFRHEDRHAIADGLRQELARLLAAPAAAAGLEAHPSARLLRADPVTLAPGRDAGAHGQAIGQALARQINPGGSA
jgi:hypothetical protein